MGKHEEPHTGTIGSWPGSPCGSTLVKEQRRAQPPLPLIQSPLPPPAASHCAGTRLESQRGLSRVFTSHARRPGSNPYI